MTLEAQRAEKAAKASAAQRRAAEPDASVWVAASAGTGKTKVLTDRVFSLLLNGAPPERILCLTFTKTAAAEMATRIAERLAGWTAASEDQLAEEISAVIGTAPDDALITLARQLFARVLDTPGGMKIQTIHAFCQSLLGRFPLEAGVPPNFGVLDERSAQELLQDAQAEVLARGEDEDGGPLSDAIATISAEVDEGGFGEALGALIRERSRLQRLLRSYGGVMGLTPLLRNRLGLGAEETAADVLSAAVLDSAFDLMGLKLCTAAMAEGGSEDRTKAETIAAWLEQDSAARRSAFESYLAAFFTDGGKGPQRKRLITKPSLARMDGADRILAAEAARLDAVRDKLRALRVLDATLALVRLGSAVMTVYRRHKRRRAQLDYDDLILETRDLLRRPGVAPWVLFRLDGGLDHILIDEAQDTNPDQWAVVRALAEEFFVGEGVRAYERTIFAVGDAKQSIYSFQRADPHAFAGMRAHFQARARESQQGWHRVDLDVSFRSTAAVLTAVDAIFTLEAAQDGVLFGDSALSHEPVRVGQAGLVELWPPVDPEEPEAPEPWSPPGARDDTAHPVSRLADLVAQRVWFWTRAESGHDDPAVRLAARGRRMRPGDILVLVRRRGDFVDALVRALKQRDVPVAGVDRMILTEQLAVMDLIAFGRALLLPEDDLTLAAVLKSPLIGFDEDALFDLAYGRGGSLWDALVDRRAERPDFAAAHERLADYRARVDFLRPYELFSALLGAGGGRRQLLSRLGTEARDPIEEFLALALRYETEHAVSLEGFLHWLEAGGQEVKRDMEHGDDAVRVMTVHGAKGLQAPVVILPDTLQGPPPLTGPFWIDEEPELVIWPPRRAYDGPLTRAARETAAQLRDQEYRRLLYVALTRAEDRLYVCGWNTRRKAPEDCWYRLVESALSTVAEPVEFDFSSVIRGGWSGAGWRLIQAQEVAVEADAEAPRASTSSEPLPAWSRRPTPPEPTPPRPLAPSRPSLAEPAALSPGGSDQGRRFKRGRLIHSLLQYLPELEPLQRQAAGSRFLANPSHGLTLEECDEILAKTLKVLDDQTFSTLFGPNSRAEVPIAGTIEGKHGPEVVFGQVDRLVVGAKAVLIVDYKTNRPAPQEPEEVAPIYLRQLALYRAVLTRLYPEKRVICALLWTEAPRLMQISDELLAEHSP